MYPSRILTVAFIACAMVAVGADAEERVWTSRDRRFMCRAEYVRSDPVLVRLRITVGEGKSVERDVLIQNLCEEDIAYIKRRVLASIGEIGIPIFPPIPPSLIENSFQSGNLAVGVQKLEAELERSPQDDGLRFALGMLQFTAGVERLGQALHRYGAKSDETEIPFLRLPVPRNESPDAIDYWKLRRLLEDFRSDVLVAEATLAPIVDPNVELPLRLASIRLDLAGDGEASEEFLVCMKRFVGSDFPILEDDPELRVRFDRGDVAWMRAYCHLLAALLDGYLAFDGLREFELFADDLFAKPIRRFPANPGSGEPKIYLPWTVDVMEPLRLDRARRHLISVAQLNREAWLHIRRETDNDYEWLPNSQQRGVLESSIRDEKIDAWLGWMSELEMALDGQRALFASLTKSGKGIDLRSLLESPPEKLEIRDVGAMPAYLDELSAKYPSEARRMDDSALLRLSSVLEDTTGVGYKAWFN